MLDDIFDSLDLNRGKLLRPASAPDQGITAEDWTSAGEWLILAERMGAERLFFVEDSPVIVFSELSSADYDQELLQAYRRAWSMARPRCLFVASDDEIRVYGLSTPPVGSPDRVSELTPLQIVSRTADVASQLAEYRRESIEDGSLFESSGLNATNQGAGDQFLIDVQNATQILSEQGLPQRIAHGLIERVVLIRYLEDRGVLTPEYFDRLLGDAGTSANLNDNRFAAFGPRSVFLSCLDDFEVTTLIFGDLARTFNGDLFVVSEQEQDSVTPEHIQTLQSLFSGMGSAGSTEPLFLWAYDFSVVPTSLISSMYEQFYHADSDDDSGTHYTPAELVEYVLRRTLTRQVLDQSPRICDAACGSGIFLVEAFRRVVRHEMAVRPGGINPAILRSLLVERVAGIDTNAEAVRLAAFSLYLAYLNYLSPRDIATAGALPRLISRANRDGEASVLVVSDAFNETSTEAAGMLSDAEAIPWTNGSFDVVLGNPPWTEPRSSRRTSIPDRWAKERGYPVGDRSLSQLFLWRALTLLREGGTAGLLVGATAFHNSRSADFRRAWSQQVYLSGIVNFTAARRLFFKNAVAPFILVQFRKRFGVETSAEIEDLASRKFEYLTMIPTASLAQSRSLAYARSERKWLDQDSLAARDYLWKTYFWGNHRDAAFMSRLDTETRLIDVLPEDALRPSYGFQWGDSRSGRPPSERLAALPCLRKIEWWGPIQDHWLQPIDRLVKREPDEGIYFGPRILVSRGIQTGFGPRVRYVDQPLAFRHNIYCIPISGLPDYVAKALSGVLLSSLARYRMFMTSGSWGIWHDSVVPSDVLNIPVRVGPEYDAVMRLIADAVDELHSFDRSATGLFAGTYSNVEEILEVINDLVFRMFQLSSMERALVHDFHKYTLDLATRQENAESLRPIGGAGIRGGRGSETLPDRRDELADYLQMFLSIWDRELEPDGELSWRVVSPRESPLVAAVFETQTRGIPSLEPDEEWIPVLTQLSAGLNKRLAKSVRIEGIARAVTDTSIVIVKRNEARLWTSSAAVEDAEATLLQAMALG